jgi:hypothetical protein
MSTLDDIAGERQRITERLARIDTERAKLAEQLAELDAAERVLSRMTPTGAPRRGRRPRTTEAPEAATAAPRGRGRRRKGAATEPATAQPRRRRAARADNKAQAKPEMPLGDATLRAIEALGNAVSAEDIREYVGREFGMQVRSNHLGMALSRHRRAGRLHEDDGRWSVQGSGEAQAEP